MTTGTLSLQDH